MTWSSGFVDSLRLPSITPIYRLQFWKPHPTRSVGNAPSYVIRSDDKRLRISTGGVRIQGTAVIPSRWSVSFGGFEVSLTGDISRLDPYVMRGSFAFIECAFAGRTGFEIIAMGQLMQISGTRGNYTMVFRDLLSALQSRNDNRIGTLPDLIKYQEFFFSTYKSTTTTSAWNVGSATMSVSTSTIFEKAQGKDGTIFCTPSSGGDPFYLNWSSAPTTTTLTISSPSSAAHPSTASASTLPTGSTIQNTVRLPFPPYSLLGQLLTSTGTGTNGPRDSLPFDWSSGLQLPAALYDDADAQTTAAYLDSRPTGIYSWDLVYKEPLSNGLRGIMDQVSTTGQWPVFRQNSFSWRGCYDPTGRRSSTPQVVRKITDFDIISIDQHLMYDPSLAAVYGRSRIKYSSSASFGVSTNPTNTLPAELQIERDNSAIYDPTFDELSMARGDISRMRVWDMYPWQRLTLRLNLSFAVLVAGDLVEITSAYISAPDSGFKKTFNGRRGMVLSSEYNINEQFCVIVIGITPRDGPI